MAALRLGRICVNDQTLSNLDYVIKAHDTIAHFCHRHELPILDRPIRVIAEDRDLLVVDKPPSMPIHACGQYKVSY